GWARTAGRERMRFAAYVALGAAATVFVGVWLVLVLVACGFAELTWRRAGPRAPAAGVHAWPLALLLAAAGVGGLGALAWTAFKVGALSYGGGFVIIPLMQADAVGRGWMTDGEFLNAVALGQATPGPVVHTVAVVGYAAAGVGGALLAAVVAFAPSFWFITLGADRFDRLRTSPAPQAFLRGAGPAAIGAIIGSAVPLALALSEWWQVGVLAGGAVLLLVTQRGVVLVLVLAAGVGALAAVAGAPLPR
ncbi:MAG: chromate transporter, partial [Actinomycetota bacterium]|nr:chromate transporter [Actinomycetota bacterium]